MFKRLFKTSEYVSHLSQQTGSIEQNFSTKHITIFVCGLEHSVISRSRDLKYKKTLQEYDGHVLRP